LQTHKKALLGKKRPAAKTTKDEGNQPLKTKKQQLEAGSRPRGARLPPVAACRGELLDVEGLRPSSGSPNAQSPKLKAKLRSRKL
jgi:hypothetical protein